MNALTRFKARSASIFAVVLASLVPMAAMAGSSAIDIGDAEAKIAAAATAGAAIGLAVLLLLIGIKVFKWVRGGM